MLSNFWNLRADERLARWRDLRLKLNELPLTDAMTEVSNLWSTAPYVTFYLAPDSPNTWPDPWTLISENYYCDLAKALGVLYTIYFSGIKDIKLELRIYSNIDTNDRYNAVYINDGQYIINHWPFEIVNTVQLKEMNLKLLYIYTDKDLALDKY